MENSFKKRIRHLLLFLYHKYKNRDKVKFHFSSEMSHRCEFEGMNMVGANSSFYGKMGMGSYIGGGSCIHANIGRFSSIGPNVKWVNATHAYREPFVTTSPHFFSLNKGLSPQRKTFAKRQMYEEFRYYDKEKQLIFHIGNDCWIGNSVEFIGGVSVGDGAVVLSHAVVTKDVPPYAIVGGLPAKVLGYRYDEETIKLLLKVQWWNKSPEWFEKHWELLCDMDRFKEYFYKEAKD